MNASEARELSLKNCGGNEAFDFIIKNIKEETDKGIFYIEIDYDKWYFWKSVYPNLERIEKMGYKVREYPKHDKDNIYVLRITW